MELEMKDKVAVVTGASRGIGRAIALTLAKAGTQVAAVATTVENAQGTADACAAFGVKAAAFGVDVADFEAVQGMAAAVTDAFGRVDVLVNNAGLTRDGVFMRMSEADWDRVLDVNLKGAFNVTRAFARGLLKNRGARVINVASVVGIGGNAGQANYAASKGGLIALTRSLAKEFGGRGVCVNALAPGFIETDMTSEVPEAHREAMTQSISLGRAGTPEDVAGGVLFLASSLSSYMTGQVVVMDGGMRL